MKRKVDVTLLGHRFTVRTERDEAYVHTLVAQLTRKLDEAKRTMRAQTREEQILFVALNLADELYEELEESASARTELRRHTEQMIAKLSDALGEEEDSSDEVALATIQRSL